MWLFGSGLVGTKAPDVSGSAWFNVSALPPAVQKKVAAGEAICLSRDLAGSIVLIDFWDYSCINCINTFPYLREWWKRYHTYNFFIIGVHTPEFEFGKDPDKVQSALLRFDLSYPVVSDPAYETWKRYGNTVWPRELVVDRTGKIRYDHKGEGNYQMTEKKIQDLIHEVHPQAQFDNPLTPVKETDEVGAVCYPTTPEIYLGYGRGRPVNGVADVKDMVAAYEMPRSLRSHQWGLAGSWEMKKEEVVSASDRDVASSLIVRYEATELFAVMRATQGAAVRVEVRQDDLPLPSELLGEDVVPYNGKTYVTVRQDRLYKLVRNAVHGQHQLELIPEQAGVAFHTFTFGSSCKK